MKLTHSSGYYSVSCTCTWAGVVDFAFIKSFVWLLDNTYPSKRRAKSNFACQKVLPLSICNSYSTISTEWVSHKTNVNSQFVSDGPVWQSAVLPVLYAKCIFIIAVEHLKVLAIIWFVLCRYILVLVDAKKTECLKHVPCLNFGTMLANVAWVTVGG